MLQWCWSGEGHAAATTPDPEPSTRSEPQSRYRNWFFPTHSLPLNSLISGASPVWSLSLTFIWRLSLCPYLDVNPWYWVFIPTQSLWIERVESRGTDLACPHCPLGSVRTPWFYSLMALSSPSGEGTLILRTQHNCFLKCSCPGLPITHSVTLSKSLPLSEPPSPRL